jgi:F-type H+-transporting ATPase subunit delta
MPQAVANRYANALADAVTNGSSADPQATLAELRSFQSIIGTSADLRIVLLSPAVSTAKKRAVIAKLADAIPLSKTVRNFLFVMVDRRRADILGEVADAFETVLGERLGFVKAAVTSAAPLSEDERARLQEALSEVAEKSVRCEFEVDPALIGGVVARIGSTVYDGSVRTQLESLRQKLMA